jgi:uncharacterized protein (TIGR02246 family)
MFDGTGDRIMRLSFGGPLDGPATGSGRAPRRIALVGGMCIVCLAVATAARAQNGGQIGGQPQTQTQSQSQTQAARPAPVAGNGGPVEAALRAEAAATIKAFNAGDAAAIAGTFLEAGELVDEDGNVFSGRAAVKDLFAKFFAKFPQATLDMEVTAARSIGDAIVVEEGVRRITAAADAAVAQMRYVAVRTKQADRWQIATYREFADDPTPTPREMLATLEWLVGDWVDESPEGRTAISYRWSEDGNFLLGEFNVAVGGKRAAKSVQRIGWDAVEGELRSWTFDSDGGFSEGEWGAGENGWIVKSEATMPDGSSGSATVTITQRDADHFVIASTDRVIGGAAEPDFKVVVARKPPAPAAGGAEAGSSSPPASR